MIESMERGLCDVECPHCGACLDVEDSDDFAGNGEFTREEDHLMVCPVCDGVMIVHVTWEPTYSHSEKVVES